MKNMLAVVLVVSVASIALSQKPSGNVPDEFRARPAPAAPPAVPGAVPAAAGAVIPNKAQKWEYKVSDRGGFEPGAWQKKLNELAKEGWELDAIDEGHYILRRPIRQLLRAIPAGLRPDDGLELGPDPAGDEAISN